MDHTFVTFGNTFHHNVLQGNIF